MALRGQGARLPVVQKPVEGNYLERVAIEHLPLSWTTLLQHAELQEPQFQERHSEALKDEEEAKRSPKRSETK